MKRNITRIFTWHEEARGDRDAVRNDGEEEDADVVDDERPFLSLPRIVEDPFDHRLGGLEEERRHVIVVPVWACVLRERKSFPSRFLRRLPETRSSTAGVVEQHCALFKLLLKPKRGRGRSGGVGREHLLGDHGRSRA